MKNPETQIQVSLADQRLWLLDRHSVRLSRSVSTARNGAGEQSGSECTPRGWHRIRARIGGDCPLNTVFVGRRPTGETYTEALGVAQPERDWILTRILWLSGLESGFNRSGDRDSMRRYIYIHGCPDSEPMGVPASHGCVRMRNAELVELFEQVVAGTRVYISEQSLGDGPRWRDAPV